MIVVGPDFRLPPTLGTIQLVFLLLAITAIQRGARPGDVYTLTSYYRDPLRNAQVGGVEGSLHQQGLALDVATNAGSGAVLDFLTWNLARRFSLVPVQTAWRELAPPITQAQLEYDHVHLELDF